jgi:hypothetical protein
MQKLYVNKNIGLIIKQYLLATRRSFGVYLNIACHFRPAILLISENGSYLEFGANALNQRPKTTAQRVGGLDPLH